MSKRKHSERKQEIKQTRPARRVFADVDVVIPVYGQFQTLDQGIQALDSAANGVNYKVYMVDDVSPDLEKNGKAFYESVKNNPKIAPVMFHKNNGGFAKTCNDGASLGSSKYILIHSTDVILTADSLKIMYEHIENNPDIAIIAPKLLFFPNSKDTARPAGKIQSVGLFFGPDAEPYHPFSGWDENAPLVNVVRDVNAITGATFLIRRNVWQSLRGFALDYGRGTYEDVDLSMRVRMAGHKIRVLPQAVGYHYTNLSVIGDGKGFPLNQNHETFRAKFLQYLPYDAWIQSGVFRE